MDTKDHEFLNFINEIVIANSNLYMQYQNEILNNNFISFKEAHAIFTKRNTEIIDNNIVVFTDFYSLWETSVKNNEKNSCNFNIFEIFAPAEKTHSYILANLLNPYAEHGQRFRFLRPFLESLNISVNENSDKWIVTAEKGRVDVLLKRIHPHSVIIIENKSNYAVDQEHQLYRYWYKEIYLPNQNKIRIDPLEEISRYSKQETDLPSTKKEIRYAVLYFTPADWKQPSGNSLTRPPGLDPNLPEKIKICPDIWLFSKEVIEWLTKSLGYLDKENYRMHEYVKQYIEYWS